jgi:hypothetical protein
VSKQGRGRRSPERRREDRIMRTATANQQRDAWNALEGLADVEFRDADGNPMKVEFDKASFKVAQPPTNS